MIALAFVLFCCGGCVAGHASCKFLGVFALRLVGPCGCFVVAHVVALARTKFLSICGRGRQLSRLVFRREKDSRSFHVSGTVVGICMRVNIYIYIVMLCACNAIATRGMRTGSVLAV